LSTREAARERARIVDAEFEALKREVFKSTSLDCRQYKEPYLKRRFNVRMRSVGAETYSDYMRHLRTHKEELGLLMDDLTINVTQFFRDPIVFKALEEQMLPLIIYRHICQGTTNIRIWSAGCSSGEEPYSVAILLKELLGEQLDDFHITILATDIDDSCLADAQAANYLPRQLVCMPQAYRERYFSPRAEYLSLDSEIVGMVTFKKHDLFTGVPAKALDMILCRNVVIYFARRMQETLYMGFFEALREGGYFVMGNTETMIGPASSAFDQVLARERVYQKPVSSTVPSAR